VRERQYSYDVARSLGVQVVRAVVEYRLDDLSPLRAMKERRLGAAIDKRVPARSVGARKLLYVEIGA